MYPLKGGARLNRQTSAHCSFGDSLVLEGLVLGGVGMTEPQGTWKADRVPSPPWLPGVPIRYRSSLPSSPKSS